MIMWLGQFGNTNLGWIRIHNPIVADSFSSLQNNLFHILTNNFETMCLQIVLANFVDEFDNVTQKFLRNPFAGRINADFYARRTVQHCCRKHGHADGLAESSRCWNQNFLRQMIPVVLHQNVLVFSRKSAFGFSFPKYSRASFLCIINVSFKTL